MKFSTRKREVRYFVAEICIDGYWFGLEDLIETLQEVKSGDIYIRNRRMADALVKRKVLRRAGGRDWAAEEGSNYERFLARMKQYKESVLPDDD